MIGFDNLVIVMAKTSEDNEDMVPNVVVRFFIGEGKNRVSREYLFSDEEATEALKDLRPKINEYIKLGVANKKKEMTKEFKETIKNLNEEIEIENTVKNLDKKVSSKDKN
jgi:hypothetical protein